MNWRANLWDSTRRGRAGGELDVAHLIIWLRAPALVGSSNIGSVGLEEGPYGPFPGSLAPHGCLVG